MNTDTLTHPLTQIGVGAAPIAASIPDAHSFGNMLVNYGGALLASTLIHLFFTIVSNLKKSKNVNSTTITETKEIVN